MPIRCCKACIRISPSVASIRWKDVLSLSMRAVLCLSSRWWCPGPDDDSLVETNTHTLIGDATSLGCCNESSYDVPRMAIKVPFGNQSWLWRGLFCYSTRYRVERKKRSFHVWLVHCPPPAPYSFKVGMKISSPRSASATLKHMGGGGGRGSFFSLDPGTV